MSVIFGVASQGSMTRISLPRISAGCWLCTVINVYSRGTNAIKHSLAAKSNFDARTIHHSQYSSFFRVGAACSEVAGDVWSYAYFADGADYISHQHIQQSLHRCDIVVVLSGCATCAPESFGDVQPGVPFPFEGINSDVMLQWALLLCR